MSEKSNSNSTFIIFMIGGVVLAMCACILLGSFMFVGLGVTQPEAVIDPIVEPDIEEQAGQNGSDEVVVESTAELAENAPLDFGANTSVFDLQEGTCFDDPITDDEELVEELSVVSCDSPHDNEVFAIVSHPDGSDAEFPGSEIIKEFADQECEDTYYTYVGIDYADSLFLYSTYYPSDESWNDGDREIICFLYHPDLEKLTRPLKGSNE